MMFNHIRQFGVFQIFLAVLLLSATVPAMADTDNAPGYKPDSVAGFTLANCGKTDYHVITAADADELTRAAAADLAATLQEITGADFSAAAGKKYRIFVGIPAPSDKTPL